MAVERDRGAGRIEVAGAGRPAAGAPVRPRKKAAPKAPGAPAGKRREARPVPETPDVELEEDKGAARDRGPAKVRKVPGIAVEGGHAEAAEEVLEAEEAPMEEGTGATPEGPPGPEEEAPGGDSEGTGPEEAPEEEPEPAEGEEAPDEDVLSRPATGYFTPASRVPMKRPERPARRTGGTARRPAGMAPADVDRPVRVRKLRKVKAAPGREPGRGSRRAWAAAAVVLIIVLAVVGWYFLSGNPTALTARAAFPATGGAGELLTFDGGNSTSTGKGISRYDWTFGDGTGAGGRRVTHFYSEAGTYTVSLTVQDQDGTRSAPYRSLITIQPLSVTVPPLRLDDRGYYSVNGTVDVRNTDTYLYSINAAGQQVTVSEVRLELSGNLTQWVRGQVTERDGFGVNHSALWTSSSESLLLSGKAQTNLFPVPISGELTYFEDSYSDAASGGVFQVDSRARTTLRLTGLPVGQASLNSTDSLRSYPAVSGITAQFRPENIYKGQRFGQSGGQQNGTYMAGNVTYYWSTMGVRNIGGMAGIGLNITAEKTYLERNGLEEFFLNVWISGAASLPLATLIHATGSSGDTHFSTDYSTAMTEFNAGTGAIDTAPQSFDPDPLDPSLFASPFDDVPESGAGNTSLAFSPRQAVQEAAARDPTFAGYLGSNPQSYAVAARYYEGQFGPGSATWNLTFSRPGATTSYWVNLTRDLLQQYTVHGDWNNTPPDVRTAEGAFSRMLTLHSAETQLRGRDAETAQTFFRSGGIDWSSGVTLDMEADSPYPGINIASMYASQERAGYAVLLRKEGYTSAFSMDTGQMLYFYTHSNL